MSAYDDLAAAEPQFRTEAAIDMIRRHERAWAQRRPKALSDRTLMFSLEPEIYVMLDYGNARAAGEYCCEEEHERMLLAVGRYATITAEMKRRLQSGEAE